MVIFLLVYLSNNNKLIQPRKWWYNGDMMCFINFTVCSKMISGDVTNTNRKFPKKTGWMSWGYDGILGRCDTLQIPQSKVASREIVQSKAI